MSTIISLPNDEILEISLGKNELIAKYYNGEIATIQILQEPVVFEDQGDNWNQTCRAFNEKAKLKMYQLLANPDFKEHCKKAKKMKEDYLNFCNNIAI